jgi:hypothetical protein
MPSDRAGEARFAEILPMPAAGEAPFAESPVFTAFSLAHALPFRAYRREAKPSQNDGSHRKEDAVNGYHGETSGGDFESDYEDEAFADQEYGLSYEADYEGDFEGDFGQGEGPFNEEEEIEMAAELLAVSGEGELDQFLGNLVRRVGKAAGQIIRSPTGKALTGLLRQAAKKALPLAGKAVGTYFGGSTGGNIGSQVGNIAGQVFGLEVEGMSPEDQELQVARRFVRLAGDAANQIAQAPPSTPPQQAARAALVAAARQHAPGLLSGGAGAAAGTRGGVAGTRRRQSGRWIRRGRNIVLLGV